MQTIERNPGFTNPLVNSTSPYLKQHAHNPVFWYPWGKEALDRAKAENKPILISIGYSTCYWCHVMEREVFENLSIASLMNRTFINIKIDREEHPDLDEIYMVARQLMTHEGGWPNNVFLTPDLKPFFAGGTYAADDAYGKPAFPRLIEWLNHSWTTQEPVIRSQADDILKAMQPYLVFEPPKEEVPANPAFQAETLYTALVGYHDERSGGFFQAPKFPHECYLNFLTRYYEFTDDAKALSIVTNTLGNMAAGGIYDHVGCGFHRYAVDKEWYVPHFEKMLYNQALLARNYTDAARLSGSEYFGDIARSILDFVTGPLTDGNGAFYSAIDAETSQVEGAYYAWTPQQIEQILDPGETGFFVTFFALADIPAFPGHKHADGQVIVARKPLDIAARENNMPYAELAALTAHIMNKLLASRNQREAPIVDDKIITSWNGLMIDAYAHAGKLFDMPRYTQIAARAASFLLEHMINNDGKLCRIHAGGKAQLDATLEDYAFLIKGLLSLYVAGNDKMILNAAISLAERVEEEFSDPNAPGYFGTVENAALLVRIKSNDDSTLPNANAAMLGNWVSLFEITKETRYRDKAQAMIEYFLRGNPRIMVESASMLSEAVRLTHLTEGKQVRPSNYTAPQPSSDGVVQISATLTPADAKPGDKAEVAITLTIKEGWHINAHQVRQQFLVPTQVDVQGEGVRLLNIVFPDPERYDPETGGEELYIFSGTVNISARIQFASNITSRPPLKVAARFQPCHGTTCHAARDGFINI